MSNIHHVKLDFDILNELDVKDLGYYILIMIDQLDWEDLPSLIKSKLIEAGFIEKEVDHD